MKKTIFSSLLMSVVLSSAHAFVPTVFDLEGSTQSTTAKQKATTVSSENRTWKSRLRRVLPYGIGIAGVGALAWLFRGESKKDSIPPQGSNLDKVPNGKQEIDPSTHKDKKLPTPKGSKKPKKVKFTVPISEKTNQDKYLGEITSIASKPKIILPQSLKFERKAISLKEPNSATDITIFLTSKIDQDEYTLSKFILSNMPLFSNIKECMFFGLGVNGKDKDILLDEFKTIATVAKTFNGFMKKNENMSQITKFGIADPSFVYDRLSNLKEMPETYTAIKPKLIEIAGIISKWGNYSQFQKDWDDLINNMVPPLNSAVMEGRFKALDF